MKEKIFGILTAMLLLFLSIIVSADPGIPHQFYGEITVNGEPANNNIIVAVVGGDYYITFTTNGMYGVNPNIFVIEDPNGDRGDPDGNGPLKGVPVSLYLGGRIINGIYDRAGVPLGTVNFENNGYTQLNLDTTTICEDGLCIGDETCETCPVDCGICTDPPTITINSPQETVYNTNKISLNSEANQPIIIWMYSLNSHDPIAFNQGNQITAINGINNLTIIGMNQNFQSGSKSISFTVDIPICGDEICESEKGETCSNCKHDCGACQTTSSGGGGGSSSSSSSSSGGGSASTTATTPYTQLSTTNSDSSENSNDNSPEPQESIQDSSSKTDSLSGITGAAIFAKDSLKNPIALIVIIALIIIVVVFIIVKRKR